MWDVFFSFFVITALALLFAHSWNLFAETLISTWELTDSEGNVKDPILQTLTYAIIMTVVSIVVLYIIHKYTDIDLGAGRKMQHRDNETEEILKNIKDVRMMLNKRFPDVPRRHDTQNQTRIGMNNVSLDDKSQKTQI